MCRMQKSEQAAAYKLPLSASTKVDTQSNKNRREPKMIIEIDLNHVVDKSISVAIVLLCFFVGMRILYGYWPWQEGPKQRRMRPAKREPDTPATLKRPQLVASPALQPEPEIKEQQPNGNPVPALALPPHIDATDDSFDRSLTGIDEARPQVA